MIWCQCIRLSAWRRECLHRAGVTQRLCPRRTRSAVAVGFAQVPEPWQGRQARAFRQGAGRHRQQLRPARRSKPQPGPDQKRAGYKNPGGGTDPQFLRKAWRALVQRGAPGFGQPRTQLKGQCLVANTKAQIRARHRNGRDISARDPCRQSAAQNQLCCFQQDFRLSAFALPADPACRFAAHRGAPLW